MPSCWLWCALVVLAGVNTSTYKLTDLQCIYRGVPVEKYSRAETVAAYWGFGLYWGKAVSQNKKGHLVGHIKVQITSMTCKLSQCGLHLKRITLLPNSVCMLHALLCCMVFVAECDHMELGPIQVWVFLNPYVPHCTECSLLIFTLVCVLHDMLSPIMHSQQNN